MAKAKETEEKIDVELKELQATLANIEEARPFDQLTVSFHNIIHLTALILCYIPRLRTSPKHILASSKLSRQWSRRVDGQYLVRSQTSARRHCKLKLSEQFRLQGEVW